MMIYDVCKKIINIFVCATLLFCDETIAKSFYKSKTNQKEKPLKVLVTVTTFPPHSCGTAVLNQITGLIDHGFDVRIYTKYKGDLSLAHPDIKKYSLLKRTYFEELPSDLDKYDIIYSQFGYRGSEFAKIKKELGLKAKLVTCFRGADASRYLIRDPHIYDELFQVGDLFLPVCHYFKKKLIKHGCDPRKIKVHHSAINCLLFSPKTEQKMDNTVRIVTVCRLVPKKGLEDALVAILHVVRKYPQARYSVIGFGPLEKKLKQLVTMLGISNSVEFLGRLSQKDVATILKAADIFVLPSVTADDGDQEGIPNAAKEAMACGIPVVTTDHAGNAELVKDTVSGFLVPEHKILLLKERIEYLINNPAMRKEMGMQGRKIIEDAFEINKTNIVLAKLFRNLYQRKIKRVG